MPAPAAPDSEGVVPMPQPSDEDEPTAEDAAIPRAWAAKPVTCAALEAECGCPGDCLRDHENE